MMIPCVVCFESELCSSNHRGGSLEKNNRTRTLHTSTSCCIRTGTHHTQTHTTQTHNKHKHTTNTHNQSRCFCHHITHKHTLTHSLTHSLTQYPLSIRFFFYSRKQRK